MVFLVILYAVYAFGTTYLIWVIFLLFHHPLLAIILPYFTFICHLFGLEFIQPQYLDSFINCTTVVVLVSMLLLWDILLLNLYTLVWNDYLDGWSFSFPPIWPKGRVLGMCLLMCNGILSLFHCISHF